MAVLHTHSFRVIPWTAGRTRCSRARKSTARTQHEGDQEDHDKGDSGFHAGIVANVVDNSLTEIKCFALKGAVCRVIAYRAVAAMLAPASGRRVERLDRPAIVRCAAAKYRIFLRIGRVRSKRSALTIRPTYKPAGWLQTAQSIVRSGCNPHYSSTKPDQRQGDQAADAAPRPRAPRYSATLWHRGGSWVSEGARKVISSNTHRR